MPGLYASTLRLEEGDATRELRWRCASVRRAIWPLLDGELCCEASADIAIHLQLCAACALEHAARLALHLSLRGGPSRHLSDAARRRILARVAGATAPTLRA
jgi:hypothetical protein